MDKLHPVALGVSSEFIMKNNFLNVDNKQSVNSNSSHFGESHKTHHLLPTYLIVPEGKSLKEKCEFFRSYSLEIISENTFDKSMQKNGKLDPNSIEYTSCNEYLFQRT